jgi:hypothetical protein
VTYLCPEKMRGEATEAARPLLMVFEPFGFSPEDGTGQVDAEEGE